MSITIFLIRAEDLTFYHSIYLCWHRHPHGLLNCSYDRHQFCKNWQTLTCKHYRIHFNTFCLAGFTDCGLLELHLLLLISHVALRASCVFILQNNKPIFTYTSCTLLLCYIELNPIPVSFNFKRNVYINGLRGACLNSVSFGYSPFIATLLILRIIFAGDTYLSI